MSKLVQAIEKCKVQMKACKIPCNDELLGKVTKACGPSIYQRDGAVVAARQKSEIDTIKKNFIAKKLGVTDEKKADAAIKKAIEKIGPSNRNKLRPVFYYLLVKALKAESKLK